jgi:Domain of unknown function (DUF4402)
VRHAHHILGAALAALAAATPANAATPVQQANGKALILVPLTLTKVDDLSFGSVVPSAVSGVVTINATTGARTFAGGVTGVPSDAGNRAYFAGAGSPSQQVIVTMNPPAQLLDGVGDTIDVLALTLDGPAIRTIDPVARTFYVGVGGTILIAVNQAEGLYTNTFDVTANYQ